MKWWVYSMDPPVCISGLENVATSDRFPLERQGFGRSDWPSQPNKLLCFCFLFVKDAFHFLPLDFSSRGIWGIWKLSILAELCAIHNWRLVFCLYFYNFSDDAAVYASQRTSILRGPAHLWRSQPGSQGICQGNRRLVHHHRSHNR